MKALGVAALTYASHGWPVFPCEQRGKRPIVAGGFHAATTDRTQIAEWWRANPDANIGLRPADAGLIVFDLDTADAEERARELGLLDAPTLAVITARGRHLYFTHPGEPIGNRKIMVGFDVRADHGFVLIPPSIHETGHVYRWVGKLADAQPLPVSAREALREPEPAPVPAPVVLDIGRRSIYVQRAIEDECAAVASAAVGERNDRLNRAAYALARFVAAGEADEYHVAHALAIAAHEAGLGRYETERTIASAFRARRAA